MSHWLFKALLIFMCGLLVSCGKIPLYSDLAEEEANEIMAVLMDRDIPCDKVAGKEGKWALHVAPEDFSTGIQTLQAIGLPKEKHKRMGEIFQKTGLVSSPTEEKIRFIDAMSQELATTLMKIDGVVSARVHIVLPENNPLSDRSTPSSAAVFIKHRSGYDIEGSIHDLKTLVTKSIEGLSDENVQVVVTQADAIPPVIKVKSKEWFHQVPLWAWCAGSGVAAFALAWFLFGRKKAAA